MEEDKEAIEDIEKRKRFAEEYLVDRNATRAYKIVYNSVGNVPRLLA